MNKSKTTPPPTDRAIIGKFENGVIGQTIFSAFDDLWNYAEDKPDMYQSRKFNILEIEYSIDAPIEWCEMPVFEVVG